MRHLTSRTAPVPPYSLAHAPRPAPVTGEAAAGAPQPCRPPTVVNHAKALLRLTRAAWAS